MNCTQARRLFGACWDDETTQVERELLESHFASCPRCRAAYDEFSRALELAASLPRVEPAPDLVERLLSRVRRLGPAPDHLPALRPVWLPVAAAAAVLVIVGILLAPWFGLRPAPPSGPSQLARQPVAQPVRVPTAAPQPAVAGAPAPRPGAGTEFVGIPDSLFDHSEDMEFILDPVTLHRGRASVARASLKQPGIQGEQAVITF
ncbi:MAG: zf-HC2 domain-containing protein [Candidatus Eisenbacteria bacterium]|nr:zf-HC2 domain-containing protein [Candidatus Eisenbacteria bacterium]